MRFLLTSLVVLVLSVLLGGVLMQDTGFVVIGIHGQVLRTSLAFFAVVLLLTVVVLLIIELPFPIHFHVFQVLAL